MISYVILLPLDCVIIVICVSVYILKQILFEAELNRPSPSRFRSHVWNLNIFRLYYWVQNVSETDPIRKSLGFSIYWFPMISCCDVSSCILWFVVFTSATKLLLICLRTSSQIFAYYNLQTNIVWLTQRVGIYIYRRCLVTFY